jgi:transposase
MKQTPDKTDRTDAQVLADLTRVGYLPRVWLAPKAVRELRMLVRHRRDLANDRRNSKLRLRGLLREQRVKDPVTPWSVAWVAWVKLAAPLSEQGRWVAERLLAHIDYTNAQIRQVERRLAQVTRGDGVVERLLEQPGIGPVTAWVLRAEIGRFDRFRSGKQLARFCGLSPRNASSGQRVADAGLIKAGNPYLRAVLIEAAHRLVHHDPRWRAFAGNLRAGGKHSCVITAAVANRWMRGLFHRLTQEDQPMAA